MWLNAGQHTLTFDLSVYTSFSGIMNGAGDVGCESCSVACGMCGSVSTFPKYFPLSYMCVHVCAGTYLCVFVSMCFPSCMPQRAVVHGEP